MVEWPEEEPAPTRYWLAGLERKLSLPKPVATARARWRVEQDYRELKDELGLDHFEGRSWQGFAPPCRFGHHRVRLPGSGTGTPTSPRTKKSLLAPTLPQVRRLLQTTLMRLSGRCPWCHTRFHPPNST